MHERRSKVYIVFDRLSDEYNFWFILRSYLHADGTSLAGLCSWRSTDAVSQSLANRFSFDNDVRIDGGFIAPMNFENTDNLCTMHIRIILVCFSFKCPFKFSV